MTTFWQDLHFAARSLVRAPGFLAVAILTLGLGIGANTAIFSVVDHVLLRTLPIEEPASLVQLSQDGTMVGSRMGHHAFSYPMYRDLRDHNEVFTDLVCRSRFSASLGYRGEAEWMFGELVSGNYFELLGVKPAIGRTITSDDDSPGAHSVVVLSYDLWVNRFGRDPNIVGQGVIVNGQQLTIAGVGEEGFDGVERGIRPKFWVPMMLAKQTSPNNPVVDFENRRGAWLQVFGRLKPGVTAEQARVSLQPLYHSILESEAQDEFFQNTSERTKQGFLESRLQVLPGGRGTPGFREQLQTPLWAVMAMVGVVLLAACVNLANLLIARAEQRQAELATRMALGAGTGRIVRQLLSESIVLALLGGLAALLFASWVTQALAGAIPVSFMGEEALKLAGVTDFRILGFTLLVASLSVLLFGLTPAVLAARTGPYALLRQQSTGSASSARLRKTLIAVQVSLSLLLLIGASLFVRSLRNLRSLDPGFRTDNVVAFAVDPTLHSYTPEQARTFFARLTGRLQAAPGIDAAAVGVERPLSGDAWISGVTAEGYQPATDEDVFSHLNGVSPGYFEVLGTPLLEGRDFRESDGADAPSVAVVNERFARHYFAGRSAVGRHIALSPNPDAETNIRIVGVVEDSSYESLRGDIPRQVFLPTDQLPFSFGMNGYVKSHLPSAQVFNAIRNVVRELDAALPVFEMRTLEEQRNRSLAAEQLVASLALAFGALATSLTAIGLYGILAYSVARRTRELGLRIALGARSANVTWLVVREMLLLWVIGVAVALATAIPLGHVVKSQLYGVAPNDWWTIAAAILVLALVAAAAAAIPAHRAARIPPTEALRYE